MKKNSKVEDKPKGLCYRCEYRALYFETQYAPRYECGAIQYAVYTCYMYRPVLPFIVTKQDTLDTRPIFSAFYISSRIRALEPLSSNDCILEIYKQGKNQYVPLYRLKTTKDIITNFLKSLYDYCECLYDYIEKKVTNKHSSKE